MQDISDEILIKASEGDIKSFEAVYRAAAGFVYNTAFRVAGSRQDAEEITQEVFMRVYNKLKEFRFESSFKTWVYRIAVNCALNRVKKTSKDRNRRVEFDENIHAAQTANDAETEIDGEHRKDMVNSLLNTLNPQQRACIVLRNIENLSYRQIADVLDVNINTVRSRLKRAREALLASRNEAVHNGV